MMSTLIGTAIGGLSVFATLFPQIRKLKAESAKADGDVLVNYQNARDAHSTACAECSGKISDLIRAISDNESNGVIDTRREVVCSSIFDSVIPKYLSYVEWEQLDCRGNERQVMLLIDDELVPELQRLSGWMKVLNAPKMLEVLDRSKATVSKRSLRSFRKLAREVRSDHTKYYAKIDNAIDVLFKS